MKIKVFLQMCMVVLTLHTSTHAGGQQTPTTPEKVQELFVALQSVTSSSSYRSYRKILDLLSTLYDAVSAQKNNQAIQDLAKQEQTILTYTKQLFDIYYPNRTTDNQNIIKQWIQDVATKEVDAQEQAVLQKAKKASPILAQFKTDKDLTFDQMLVERKQFLTSPYWNKLTNQMPSMNNQPLINGVVVVKQGERGQEKYTVKQ